MTIANRYHNSILAHQEAFAQFRIARDIVYRTREWHYREQRKHKLHPAVLHIFDYYNPVNWTQLLLEWPYVSDTDVTRLAYTRSEQDGIADRQVITTVGKYLKRHWPDIPDHVIRDAVAKYATALEFRIQRTTAEIVNAVQEGPSSCMQWEDCDVDSHGFHPYEHYDPKYGWHVAIGIKEGRIQSRALLMQRDNNPNARKYFVRTYQRKEGETYSQPSDEMIQWLKNQGYEHRHSWDGERLKYIDKGRYSEEDEIYAPYLDGGSQHVTIERELDQATGSYVKFLRITGEDDGDYNCTGTNGTAEYVEGCTCEDCGSRIRDDERYTVGAYENRMVGNCCIDDYTHVTGRRGNEYYVANGEAVEVDGDYYDVNYLYENDIVELHDGEYAKEDDCVMIDNEWYRTEDDSVVCDHRGDYQLLDNCVELHNGDYALEDETWECAGSGNRYLADEDTPVEVDGEMYHEDHAPESSQLSLLNNEETETTKEAS